MPFKNQFNEKVITDPYVLKDYFRSLIQNQDKFDGAVIDSITFMMDMFESKYIYQAADTRAAWGHYQQFFKELLQDIIPQIKRPIVLLAHTRAEYDEKTLSTKVKVPIKGALANTGVEAFFSTVVAAKKVDLEVLENYKSDLLTITEDDEIVGYKHVFQTRLTKDTVNERIRSPMGLFSKEQTYMDNNVQLLIDHLNAFYGH